MRFLAGTLVTEAIEKYKKRQKKHTGAKMETLEDKVLSILPDDLSNKSDEYYDGFALSLRKAVIVIQDAGLADEVVEEKQQ